MLKNSDKIVVITARPHTPPADGDALRAAQEKVFRDRVRAQQEGHVEDVAPREPKFEY